MVKNQLLGKTSDAKKYYLIYLIIGILSLVLALVFYKLLFQVFGDRVLIIIFLFPVLGCTLFYIFRSKTKLIPVVIFIVLIISTLFVGLFHIEKREGDVDFMMGRARSGNIYEFSREECYINFVAWGTTCENYKRYFLIKETWHPYEDCQLYGGMNYGGGINVTDINGKSIRILNIYGSRFMNTALHIEDQIEKENLFVTDSGELINLGDPVYGLLCEYKLNFNTFSSDSVLEGKKFVEKMQERRINAGLKKLDIL